MVCSNFTSPRLCKSGQFEWVFESVLERAVSLSKFCTNHRTNGFGKKYLKSHYAKLWLLSRDSFSFAWGDLTFSLLLATCAGLSIQFIIYPQIISYSKKSVTSLCATARHVLNSNWFEFRLGQQTLLYEGTPMQCFAKIEQCQLQKCSVHVMSSNWFPVASN